MSTGVHRAALVCVLAGAACTTDLGASATGLQSFVVKILDPAPESLGSPESPIRVDRITVDVEAQDASGARFGAREVDADVFVAFSGNKVGRLTACGGGADSEPLTTVRLVGGVAEGVQVDLVRAFGKATVWFEDPFSHAVGATTPIYFPEFTMEDLLTPLDLQSTTATWCSPWYGRYVTVDHAADGGTLVVDSVFGNAYTVCDTARPYDPAAMTGGFNCLYVFSFSRPPRGIVPGRVIRRLSGNFTKFNGFSELSFPLQEFGDDAANRPAPVPLTGADLKARDNVRLLRRVASSVSIAGTICPIDPNGEAWTKFRQFEVDIGNGCDPFADVSVELPSRVFGPLDPASQAGQRVAVTGMFRNSSGQNPACDDVEPVKCATNNDCLDAAGDPRFDSDCQSRLVRATCVEGVCRRGPFNFWTVIPRDISDVSLP